MPSRGPQRSVDSEAVPLGDLESSIGTGTLTVQKWWWREFSPLKVPVAFTAGPEESHQLSEIFVDPRQSIAHSKSKPTLTFSLCDFTDFLSLWFHWTLLWCTMYSGSHREQIMSTEKPRDIAVQPNIIRLFLFLENSRLGSYTNGFTQFWGNLSFGLTCYK